jgi:DNA repair photolyase
MLGELYEPRGLALETATAVLETPKVFAVNIAYGCTNKCRYCYVPKVTHRQTCDFRLPQKSPVKLVQHQLETQWRFHWKSNLGVFLSFITDPFLPHVDVDSRLLIRYLLEENVKVATLSKLDVSFINGAKHGMTIVSPDDYFWRDFEPNTIRPKDRLLKLKACHDQDNFVWISMEPYPPTTIFKQDLSKLLEQLSFVNLIVFGKWNYDPRGRTPQAREDYSHNVEELTDFCKSHGIRLHVKSDTLKFIEAEP